MFFKKLPNSVKPCFVPGSQVAKFSCGSRSQEINSDPQQMKLDKSAVDGLVAFQ